MLRQIALFGPVDDEELSRIVGMENDELERYEAELFERVAKRFSSEGSKP